MDKRIHYKLPSEPRIWVLHCPLEVLVFIGKMFFVHLFVLVLEVVRYSTIRSDLGGPTA